MRIFAPMTSVKDEQVSWLRAVVAHTGLTATQLARRAKLAPSTIHRPLNEPDFASLLSARSIAAIAETAGLKPMEFPARARGMSEADAVPYEYGESENAIDNFDRAVRALCAGRNGRDAWVMKSHALDASGVLPGDVLIMDMNRQAKAQDIVCAQIYDWSRRRAETVFRIYDAPYLVTHSVRGMEKPVLVDNDNVAIKGVVENILRSRAP